MRRFLSFFLAFCFLILLFPLPVLAVDETKNIPLTLGVGNYSTGLVLYGPSNTNYPINCISSLSYSDLSSYDKIVVHSDVSYLASPAISIFSTETPISYTLPSGGDRKYLNFTKKTLFSSEKKPFYGGDYVIDLSSFDLDPALNYYLTVGFKVKSIDFSRSAPEPTPSPVPTASPAPTAPPSSKTSQGILDKYALPEGETVLPLASDSYSVFPYSIELHDSSDGLAYIMHYRLDLPARFYRYNHTGTGTMDGYLDFDVTIDHYVHSQNQNGTVQSFSDLYLSTDGVSYDSYNRTKSTIMATGDEVLTGDCGFALYNMPIINNMSQNSYALSFSWDVVITHFNTTIVNPTAYEYECTFHFNSLKYTEGVFEHISDSLDSSALDQIKDNTDAIKDEQKHQNEIDNEHYQQEQDKISEAESSITDGVGKLTETLSTWEIITMPFNLMKDLFSAISSDGSTGFTFPSFSLMGYEIWPSYTFDLNVIAEKFPVLVNALHFVFGLLIVRRFIYYLFYIYDLMFFDHPVYVDDDE